MLKFSKVKKALIGYMALIGVLAHIGFFFGFIFALKHFQLTPRQFIVKTIEKSPIEIPFLVEFFSPVRKFSDHQLDGQIQTTHPRIILPALASWSGSGRSSLMAERIALYKSQGIKNYNPCGKSNDIMALASCWVSDGKANIAALLIGTLKDYKLQTPTANGTYGNGWQLAFAYDLIANYTGLSVDDRALIELKIERALLDTLKLLDDPSPSLWHGRTSLASMAWLMAITLNPEGQSTRNALIRRAQGHFLDVVRAMELTEGWPEGYNYWIQNRALVFTLAASAYINGLNHAQHKDRILALLKRVGLWHIYATRPDNRIENLGDEGSRVDLKDETRRVIDVIAQTTRDPNFARFSHYLSQLHGAASYYHGYRWGFRLFNDPTLNNLATINTNWHSKKDADLKIFSTSLPKTDLFGRGALNQAYIRSDWSPSATFISFRAGHTFTHHGHYDAGHFSIYKGAPLAINSSSYGGYKSANRLNYSIRTVAKNALLILRPGEKVRPNRFFHKNVADGGQRIILPTGSGIQDVADWANQLDQGMYFSGGKINHFQSIDRIFTYIASDLTKAYNTPEHDEGGRGGKVSEVKRQLLYLANEDRLFIYDRIVSIDAAYTKKWLLHSVNKPQVKDARVLKGIPSNGISETLAATAMIHNKNGRMRLDRIYPEDARMRLVGGPDYQFYVESDGDDSVLNGENFVQGVSLKPWYDIGMWRIEIQPGVPRLEDEFLVSLSPSINTYRSDAPKKLRMSGIQAKGVETQKNLVVFFSQLSNSGNLEIMSSIRTEQRRLYVLGLPAGMLVKMKQNNNEQTAMINSEGVLSVSVMPDSRKITLNW